MFFVHSVLYNANYADNSDTYTPATLSKEFSHNPSYSDNSVQWWSLIVSFLRSASSNCSLDISPSNLNISCYFVTSVYVIQQQISY